MGPMTDRNRWASSWSYCYRPGVVTTAGDPPWVRSPVRRPSALGPSEAGWKIMKTLGRKIYSIKPIDSLDSQLISAGTIILSTAVGAPVSSTQVVASSIMGVGAAERAKMVQWSVGKHMAVSWLLTIPASALLSAIVFNISQLHFELLRWMHMDEAKGERKGRGLGSLFPPKYDFHGMLFAQAEKTTDGVRALTDWLKMNDLTRALPRSWPGSSKRPTTCGTTWNGSC